MLKRPHTKLCNSKNLEGRNGVEMYRPPPPQECKESKVGVGTSQVKSQQKLGIDLCGVTGNSTNVVKQFPAGGSPGAKTHKKRK